MVCTLRAFLKFCYLCRCHTITEHHIHEIEDALSRFHQYWEVFRTGEFPVVNTFSLPRQHAAKHHPELIQLFGAPNGLCSSITECKHIKAVKEPWHRSNRFNTLGQMLLTNQHLDKLATSQINFEQRGMLQGLCLRLTSTLNTIGNCSYSMVHLPVQNADRNCYRACLSVVGVLRRSPWIWATIHQQEAYCTRWQWLMWSRQQSSESGTACSACTYTT